jgi:tRNA pseudouridine55 synthase
MLPCGILNLHKPAEMTSRQAVDLVQRLVRPARAGHAGTLDPLATGVLIVCIGAATRLIGYVQRMPKRYTGTFLLGRQSPTEDVEGDVTELPDAPRPTREQIVAAAGRFVGRIQQRPPAFSALKVAGRRAYDLARRGQQPQLPPRPVEVYSIEVVAYQYPELIVDVQCGSGTYIRSLGRDLAESLGTAAVMSALVRSSIGGFLLADAVNPRELNSDSLPRLLHPPLRAIDYLPRVRLSADQARRLQCGLSIAPNVEWLSQETTGDEIVAVDPSGVLVGILTPSPGGGLQTLRNMPTEA